MAIRETHLKEIGSLLEFASKFLPEGIELWDFGGNNIVAPTPDTIVNDANGCYYLTMAAITRGGKTKEDPFFITAFTFDITLSTPQDILDGMKKAVEYNKTQETAFYRI